MAAFSKISKQLEQINFEKSISTLQGGFTPPQAVISNAERSILRLNEFLKKPPTILPFVRFFYKTAPLHVTLTLRERRPP
ncbi:MAG: hypothetical protein LBB66_10530 [Desulfovibrio sp.]|nr:hypothetical protein [Desulfovibrio sp.]